MMEIRKTREEDLARIMEIYQVARLFMINNGNPNQWGDNWPPEDLIHDDIQKGKSYVCINEDEQVIGTFYYDYGADIEPTYEVIENGKWLDSSAYGVVHRLAGDGSQRGIGAFCLSWAYEQCKHIRIDTHKDNKVMQALLEKLGFKYCGIIYVRDGSERVAYEK